MPAPPVSTDPDPSRGDVPRRAGARALRRQQVDRRPLPALCMDPRGICTSRVEGHVAVLLSRTQVEPPPRDPVRRLARWAARECPAGADVLNVGAGADVSGPL